ncbi:MAG: CHASE3 domain-containing protein [Planctomycetes bacterium]|nr:CHASE3 domain-containing protein [Planctomycetota bacterium]
MKYKDLPLSIKLPLGSAGPLILVAILGFVTWTSIEALLDSNRMVDHTHNVIAEAGDIEAAAVDMETGMRGYLLAGKQEFLSPYNAGQQKFKETVAGLKETVSDNPAQVQLLGELETTIDEWVVDVTTPAIELRGEIGDALTMNDMAAEVGKAKGKEYFDAFRGGVATFVEREESLMEQRQEVADKALGTSGSSLSTLVENQGWVDHTHAVIAQANGILSAAVDMETGMRGFLLAGSDEFLEPYTAGKATFFSELTALQGEVSDNAIQVKLLGEIASNIQGWVDEVVEPAIQIRREVGEQRTMDEVVELVGQAKGKTYFDKFRGQIAIFVAREAKLLDQRALQSKEATTLLAESIQGIGDSANWVQHTHEVIASMNSILASAVDMETGMRGYLLAGEENFLAPYRNGKQQFMEQLSALKDEVSDNPTQVATLDQLGTTIADWQSMVTEPTIALRRKIGTAKTMDDMADLVSEARGKVYFDKFRSQIAEFAGRESRLMEGRKEEAESTASQAIWVIVIGTLLTITIAILISLYVSRKVTAGVKRVLTVVELAAVGNLTGKVGAMDGDEIGQLGKGVDDMIDNLLRVISQLNTSSEALSMTGSRVAEDSEVLAQGSASQAASMEELSASLEEMSSMIRVTADHANEAKGISNEASRTAEKGNLTMERMKGAIQNIEKSSKETASIVSTIEEIAFQTNLLALNAAVEAARAGDAGTGFAVVAAEVGSLANRSAAAAKTIADLIAQAGKETEKGVEITKEISDVLEEIVGGSADVNDLITSIAAAATEQSEGIRVFNDGLLQIGNVTQANSATSEQSAQVANGLRDQVTGLTQIVSTFQVR